MVNGLYVHGIVPPEKRNVIAAAGKVIGDLIEGAGEGNMWWWRSQS
jgi:hypothetical protein